MTDGIIQEVFKKIRFQNCVLKSMILPCNCDKCKPINAIQQELIEKIKPLFTPETRNVLIKIIGDNQE